MTELVTFGESMLRFSPPAHERLETVDTLDVRVAGAESNVAVAASRIGTDAIWISKLPDSPLGRRVTSFLHGFGLETDVVWARDGRQGVYFVEFGGQPRGTQVLYDRVDSAVTTATVDELPTDRIAEAAVFATSGITPALSDTLENTTAELLALARDVDTTTVLDLNYRSKLWSPDEARGTLEGLFPDVDMFVVGEDDAERVLDVAGPPGDIVQELTAEWGFDRVVLTRGKAGAVARSDGELFEQRIFETDTIDPIGTGDAFLGVLLGRLIEGAGMEEAMAWAAAAAALKRTIPGDIAVVTREEIERVLDAETPDIER